MAAAILARTTLLEARRGGLPWIALGVLVLALALAAFLSQVALTESRELQAAVTAALLRAGAVFLLAAHVASSVLREVNDRGLELMLALPLSRTTQYVGRLGGYVACGLALAAAFSAPLLLWASPAAVLAWGVSLALECALVAAATLFFSMSLASVVAALAATAGLYLLARSIAAIQAMAASPLAEPTLASRAARGIVDAIAAVLPRLEGATRSEWLLYALPESGSYAAALAGLLLYTALLVAAGLFDFHRRGA
ncbi:MAG TPA: ABC transporter permease [Burkholderiales bacterium]|nr:ABC transporter permease [Burkholderiales bacterium]